MHNLRYAEFTLIIVANQLRRATATIHGLSNNLITFQVTVKSFR